MHVFPGFPPFQTTQRRLDNHILEFSISILFGQCLTNPLTGLGCWSLRATEKQTPNARSRWILAGPCFPLWTWPYTCRLLHTVDGQNPAPAKGPWNDDSPVTTNKPWFPTVSTWCERSSSIHSATVFLFFRERPPGSPAGFGFSPTLGLKAEA